MRASKATEEQELKWEPFNALPQRALAWLTLSPAWPSAIAERGFPLDPTSNLTGPPVTEKLQKEADRGFLTALPPATPWEGPIFSLPASTRRSAQELFALDPRYGREYLRRELSLSGQTMKQAGSELLEYDPMLSRWAKLAALADNDGDMADEFERQINAVFQLADSARQLTIPEASRWIDAAQPIADILGGPLLVSVGRARRRLELYSRRANDKRKLANYLPRPEQDAAIDALLQDDEHWTLHFAGEGGVGKTMLLRHVTERPGLAVSRVDFDYLNPDYPRRAPGLLLVALSEEFRLQAGPDMEVAFERFDRTVKSLHSQIEGKTRLGQTEATSLDSALFQDVLQTFTDALRKLAENRQPVLLLDTCEELATVRPDGSIPDNVVVTFNVLNRMHDLYKRIRVIFAGRRALASAGYGDWTAVSPLPPQPHLRLHLIEHFTRQQADDYLSTFREEVGHRTVGVAKDQIPVLRDLSRIASNGVGEKFSIPGHSSTEKERFNAFDLEIYADWVCRDPSLSREKLAKAGRHYYVRERIVGRAARVRPLIPLLAVCGRFDTRILKAFVSETSGEETTAGTTLEQRVRSVTDLEWIQPDRAVGPDMWRVDNPLRERLLDYYESQETSVYQAARRTVADVLRDETVSRPFPQLSEQYFEVALDTLSDEPQTAAAWWVAIEDRIAKEGQWIWASRLISLLLALPALASDRPVSLRAAVLATRAAALLHTGEADPLSIWRDVEVALGQYPDAPQRQRIEARMQLAMGRVRPWESGLGWRSDPQLLASCLAQMEAAIEHNEPSFVYITSWLDEVSKTAENPGVRAFVLSLKARTVMTFAGVKEPPTGTLWREAQTGGSAGIANAWLDWLPPDDLVCRIALEFIRTGRGTLSDVPQQRFSRTVDADRLASAVLLHFGEPSEDRTQDVELAAQRPRCNSHRYYPPYFVAALWQSARDGAPGEALSSLGKLASSFASLTDVALAIDRVCLDIRLRYRIATTDVPPSVRNSTAESDQLLAFIYRRLFLDSGADSEDARISIHPSHESVGRIAKDRSYPVTELAMREAELAWIVTNTEWASALDAADQCSRAGDRLGEMLGLVTEALWAASNRDRSRLNIALEKLRRSYDLVLASRISLGLPEWAELKQAVRESRASGVLDRVPENWRSIAVRLAAVLHYEVNGGGDSPDLLSWVRRNYSVATWRGQRIPTELEFLVRREPERKIPEWIDTFVKASAGIGLGFPIGTALGVLFKDFLYPVFVAELRRLGVSLGATSNGLLFGLLLVFGVPLAFTQLPRLIGSLFSLYFRLFEFQAEFVPAEPPANLSRPLDVGYTARYGIRFLGFYLGGNQQQFQPTTEERYAWLNEQMSARKSKTNYRFLRGVLLGATTEIEISIDENAAAAPWEAIIQLPSHEAVLKDSPFRTRRTLPVRQKRSEQQPAKGRLKVAVWSSAPETLAASHKIIELLRTGGGGLEVVIPPTPDATASDTDILVIFGNPREGTIALGLEVEGAKQSANVAQTASYSSAASASQLYTVTSITSRCPHLRMCILQTPPSSIGPRVSSDRREAALMRRVGAELFRTGIPAVLIFPSAIEQVRNEILGKLRPVFRGRMGPRNTARTIVATVNDIQRELAKLVLPDREASQEIALDVCLYIEERVDLRVVPANAGPVTT